jgi:phosphohistidine phosphatase
MFVLLVRHAIAAPLGGKVKRDADRPLTARGRHRFHQVARVLSRLMPRPQAILTSPLLRARETALLACEAWHGPNPVVLPALVDGNWPAIRRRLAGFEDKDTVVLVGHEDWMSTLTARLLGSKSCKAFAYRKGGIAMLEVHPADAKGTLIWFIPPRVFREM